VPREEKLGPRQVVRANVKDVAEAFDEWTAAAITEQVPNVGAGGRAEKAVKHDQQDRVMAGRRPGRGDEQQRLAWEGHARALDQDADARQRTTEHVDQGRPVHEGSYTGRPDAGLR